MKEVDDDGDVTCNVITYAGLDLATSDELKFALRRVHEYRLIDEPDEYLTRCMALGFTYFGYNLLNDRELDEFVQPAEQFMLAHVVDTTVARRLWIGAA